MWWEEVILVGPRPSAGGARKWKCRYCSKEITGGTDRVKQHLVGEGKGVKDCTAIPDIDRERLLEFSRMLNDIKIDKNERLHAARRTTTLIHPSTSSDSCASTPKTSCFGLESYFSPPQVRKRQKSIQDNFDPTKKDRLWRAIGRHFIYNKIPFNVIRSNHFKYMMAEAANYGPNIELPKYEELRVSLVAREKKEVTMTLETLRGHWVKWGFTLIVDGWCDTRGRNIHGVIASCRGRNYYLNSYDITVLLVRL